MIVYAIPEWTRTYYGSGNWKDVEARCLLLSELGLPVREVVVSEKHPESIMDALTADDRHLLIEYSRRGSLLRTIKSFFPLLRIHVRTHNAEALHFLHQVPRDLLTLKGGVKRYYGALRLLASDACCRWNADTLLGISGWDDRHYWRRLPGRARVMDMPYFSPWPWIRPSVPARPWPERDSCIVCMPGTTGVPIGELMASNFAAWVKKCPDDERREWNFALTHHPDHWSPDPDPSWSHLSLIRNCSEPWDLLCRVKAVAVLTPLGYGCKTTILDALAAGCHVLVHPVLARRIDPIVRAACIVVDPECDSVASVLEKIEMPSGHSCVNMSVRESALRSLQEVFK